jgi:hypothetical protein
MRHNATKLSMHVPYLCLTYPLASPILLAARP